MTHDRLVIFCGQLPPSRPRMGRNIPLSKDPKLSFERGDSLA